MLYVTARPRLTEHFAGIAAGFPFTFIRYRHCAVVLITTRVMGTRMEVATCELELPKLGITRRSDCRYRHFTRIISCD